MKQRKKEKLTKEEKKLRAAERRKHLKQEITTHPVLFFTYVILRALVIAVLIRKIFQQEYYDVFLCSLTLLLFTVPSFVERKLHIDVPNTLEIIILLFIFSAEILGEIQEYYLIFPFWDTMLHTLNGFLMAAIGIAMGDILNRSRKFKVRLSPAFVAVVAFCFSMTIGVLWEFFEYGVDTFLHMDMQKDTVIPAVTSILLNPEGRNAAVTVPIESIVINGEPWAGYIDIGLHDTMKDLLVNFIGAVTFSLIGMLYIIGRNKGKTLGKIVSGFVPRLKSEELSPKEEPGGLLEPLPLSSDTEPVPGDARPDCIFCKIIEGAALCHKIYEDEETLAFLDIAGDAEGHTLVIPKQHAETLMDCKEETLTRLMETVKLVSQHYVKNCGYQGVNVLNASGKSAQQSVPHLHFHIIPRRENDGLNTWPELGQDNTPLEELEQRLTMLSPEQS